jgi:hypothetical protein
MAAALPNWLVNAMADYPPMHNVSFQYHAETMAFLAAVPPEDAVSADSASATHLAHRFVLFHFPEGLDRADGDPARPPLCARVLSLAETDPRAEFSSFALLALNLQTGELFRRSLRACSQG